jgi:hypothetical protein
MSTPFAFVATSFDKKSEQARDGMHPMDANLFSK